MSSPYNLRKHSRNRRSQSICFLERALNDGSFYQYNPEVRLERLQILDTTDDCSVTFTIKNGKIIKKEKPKTFIHITKYLMTVLSSIILITSLVYFKNELEGHYHKIMSAIEFSKTMQCENSNFKLESFSEKENNLNLVLEIMNTLKTQMKELETSESDNLLKPLLANEEVCNEDEVLSSHSNASSPVEELADDFFEKNLLTDYALQSRGAKILSIFDTEPYGFITLKFWNIEFEMSHEFLQRFISVKGPASVLVPWVKPGDCWAFRGSNGKVLIELSEKVIVSGISIDHIRHDLLPEKSLRSAPKNFTVLGFAGIINEMNAPGIHLGSYAYNISGPIMQTFLVVPTVRIPFKVLRVDFESNHGNPRYTCVYKIRVHGYSNP